MLLGSGMSYFRGGVICDFSFLGRLNHHASLPVLLSMRCIAPGGLQGAGGFSSGYELADFNDARPGELRRIRRNGIAS